MPFYGTCELCGAPTQGRCRTTVPRYCSKRCAAIVNNAPRRVDHGQRVCVRCGATYQALTRAQRHCGQRCANLAVADINRKVRPTRPCDHCGTVYTVRYAGHRYCSIQCGHPPEPLRGAATAEARWWSRVNVPDDPGECWMWGGSPNNSGYGQFYLWTDHTGKRVYVGAHVFSYTTLVGPVPDGNEVCHSCDVNYPVSDFTYRRCVNPGHLWDGTPSENAADCWQKGRHVNVFARPEWQLRWNRRRDSRLREAAAAPTGLLLAQGLPEPHR
jgi:hypothetical protein